MIATDKSLLMEQLRIVGSIGKVQPAQEFRAAPWHLAQAMGDDLVNFTFGTCDGLMRVLDGTLGLIAINNEVKGNGQFKQFMQFFEELAAAMYLDTSVLEIENRGLYKHLVEKWGYIDYKAPGSTGLNLIKRAAK